jgi:uncharacterized protein YdeI (BOF family)
MKILIALITLLCSQFALADANCDNAQNSAQLALQTAQATGRPQDYRAAQQMTILAQQQCAFDKSVDDTANTINQAIQGNAPTNLLCAMEHIGC